MLIIQVMRDHPAILAVDDEPDLRTLMERILKRRGYEVTTASGVTEALAELDTMPEQPDLLITDVSMPDGRGSDLVEHLRRRHAGVTVLYVSGYSRERAVAEGLIDAASPLLEKPFNPTQLAEAAAAALAGSAPVS
jgi:DNA-binding NtrC family response regulator